MIVVRNTFQVHPGQMKHAVEVAKEGRAVMQRLGFPVRLSVDVVSDFYTLVLENELPSLSDYDALVPKTFGDPEWQKWYQGFTPLVRCGRREVFRTVD